MPNESTSTMSSPDITNSYLYLSTDRPDPDGITDDLSSADNDTSLMMELANQFDSSPMTSLRKSFQNIAISDAPTTRGDKGRSLPTHSTPLPLKQPLLPTDDGNETERLFRLYQPMVDEELRQYIHKVVNAKQRPSVSTTTTRLQKSLESIDEADDENKKESSVDDGAGSEGSASLNGADGVAPTGMTNIASPDTTPPNSRDYTEEKTTAISDSESDYDTSYVPKSIKSKLNSPDVEEQIPIGLHPRGEDDDSQNRVIAELRQTIEQQSLQLKALHKENMDLRIQNGDLELRLMGNLHERSRLVAEVEPEKAAHDDLNERVLLAKCDEWKRENDKLKWKLDTAKKCSTEMANEIAYLHKLLEDKHKLDQLVDEVARLQAQIGDSNKLVRSTTVQPQFRAYYLKYKLDDIDAMTKVDLSNLVKNISLTLMVGQVATLPEAIIKIGQVLKISSLFMDRVHGIVYDDKSIDVNTPSTYIRPPHNADDLLKLEHCLRKLAQLIRQNYGQ